MQLQNNQPSVPEAARKGSIWDNKAVLVLVSLLCGFLSWLFFTMYIDQNGSKTIYDASINYANNATIYTTQGLDIVQRSDVENVRVLVEGNNTIVGNITSADIMVYPDYSTISGSGEVTLRLAARMLNSSPYSGSNVTLTVERPTTVNVVFDAVSEKQVPVMVDTSAVQISEGFILNKAAAIPAEVTLRGPTSELEQIGSVVASVEMSSRHALSDSVTTPATLEMRDRNGDPFVPEYAALDNDSVNVTLTVYQVRELPLTVDFINTPNNFDTNSLHYNLSQETLRVAGPAKTVSNMDSLHVTSFDLGEEFALDRDFQRQIELPGNLVSQDGVSTVTVSFDTENIGYKTLNISNIRAINVPSNYDLKILSSIVNGVVLYGPADEIQKLSADSVVAQIDCQSISMTQGQQTVAVSIQIPSSTRIFATGHYTVQCEITSN